MQRSHGPTLVPATVPHGGEHEDSSPARSGGARLAVAGLDALVAAFRDELVELVAERVLAGLSERQAEPALLDRRGLAQALAVGVDTLDKLRQEGLPELRVGDSPRFELEAVLGWLRGRE